MTHNVRFALALLVAAIATVPGSATAQNIHMSTPTLENGAADCSAFEVSSDDGTVARAEESVTLPPGRAAVHAPQNGGIWIVGSSGGAFDIRACKFAVASSAADAESLLQQVRVNSSERVTADGPGTGQWLVHFIVRMPGGGSLSAESNNGPITIRGVDATLTARAVNGPISVSDSRGKIDVETVNGPISLERSSGDVSLEAQNGPVSVKLEGNEWDGEGLRGTTRNGPLSVSVPKGYGSGVVVESDGRSPVRCDGCADARRAWGDDSRRLELGSGPERVRLSTVNGPVTVKQ
jgi:hypothetical protein